MGFLRRLMEEDLHPEFASHQAVSVRHCVRTRSFIPAQILGKLWCQFPRMGDLFYSQSASRSGHIKRTKEVPVASIFASQPSLKHFWRRPKLPMSHQAAQSFCFCLKAKSSSLFASSMVC